MKVMTTTSNPRAAVLGAYRYFVENRVPPLVFYILNKLRFYLPPNIHWAYYLPISLFLPLYVKSSPGSRLSSLSYLFFEIFGEDRVGGSLCSPNSANGLDFLGFLGILEPIGGNLRD